MARTLRLEIQIDEHGAIQKLQQVDAAFNKTEASARRSAGATGEKERALTNVANASGKASTALELLNSTLVRYLTGAAIGGAIVKTLEYGASLEKAAIQIGATAGGIQRLENIAAGSNTSLGALTNAIAQMQIRLAGGDASAVRAIERLGLSVEQLFQLNPDQQFIAIAKALQQIHSSEQQLQIGREIFGRQAVEVIGALRGEVVALSGSISTLTEQQVRDLARAETAWQQLWVSVKRYSGLLLSDIQKTFSDPLGSRQPTGLDWLLGKFGMRYSQPEAPDLPRPPALATVPTDINQIENMAALRTAGGSEATQQATRLTELMQQARHRTIDLLPMPGKDISFLDQYGQPNGLFQPTGAYAQVLAEQTGIREAIEAQQQLEQEMKDNLLIVGQYPTAFQAAGEAAAEAAQRGVSGYDALTESLLRAQSQIKLMVPANMNWVRAYEDAGFMVHDLISGGQGASDANMRADRQRFQPATPAISIDARGGIFDSERTVEHFATKVRERLSMDYGAR